MEKVNSASSDAPAFCSGTTLEGKGHKHVYKTISEYLEGAPEDMKALYQTVEDLLLSIGEDVDKNVLKFYVTFKRIKNFACVEVSNKSKCVLVFLKCPITADTFIEGLTRDVSGIGHLGTGDLEVTIRSKEDIERARRLFEMSYQLS